MTKLIPLLLTLALSLPALAYEDGRELPVTFHRQHNKVWCWAAAVAMMVDYYQDYPVSDCVVLTEFALRQGDRVSCCENPGACNRTGKLEEMGGMMSGIYGVHGVVIDIPLPYRAVMREIEAGRPLIAAIDGEPEGHIVVISGYVPPDKVVVLNPEKGRRVMPISELTGPDGKREGWRHTFLFSSRRTDEPKCHSFEEVVVSPDMPRMTQQRVRCRSNAEQ